MKTSTRGGSFSKYTTKAGARLWRYRFDADPIDGKRRQVSEAGFATRGAAVKACGDAIQAYEGTKGIAPAPPPSKETVGDWVRLWLRDYAPQQCADKTLERYEELADYVLKAQGGAPAKLAATPLAEVKHTHVEPAIYALLRMPAKRKAHLSTKTVREVAAVLSVALNEAFRLDKITVNPLLRVKLPKVEKSEARSLSREEVQRLREACRGDWTFAFVEASLATGCRRGELLALKWSDIDWLAGIVTVSKSLQQTKAGLRVKPPKGNKPRRFRIGPTAIAALRFEQERQREARRLYDYDYKDQGLVFCEPDGSYLWPDLVSQTIVRRLRKSRIAKASLHTLRHTLASILLSRGVPLPAVSARLGSGAAGGESRSRTS